VYLYSQGVPRVVNLVCHRALVAAQRRRSPVVEAEMVATAAEGLELTSMPPPPSGKRSWFERFRRR
jgi:hypothetical protein